MNKTRTVAYESLSKKIVVCTTESLFSTAGILGVYN